MKNITILLLPVFIFGSCSNQPATNLKYWSDIMNTNPTNETLNSFTFEEKYKIIEYAYNELGIKSNFTYEEVSSQIESNFAFMSDEFLYGDHQINKLAYYIFGFWGSELNMNTDSSKLFNYVKLSDQVWFFEGEQGDLDYESYILKLDKMRNRPNPFSNWEETYDKDRNSYMISFNYQNLSKKWRIENEIPGLINNKIFQLYTDLCEDEYIDLGNYYFIMESGGGIAMYLPYSTEEYLRTLWDFPKVNTRGRFRTLAEYGEL